MVSFSDLLNIVQILKFLFGIQNTADAQGCASGGAQQQHLLTNQRMTPVFRGRILHLSWPINGNGQTYKISASVPEIDRLRFDTIVSQPFQKNPPFMYIDCYKECLWYLLWQHKLKHGIFSREYPVWRIVVSSRIIIPVGCVTIKLWAKTCDKASTLPHVTLGFTAVDPSHARVTENRRSHSDMYIPVIRVSPYTYP